jgi:hypothetical protein
MSAGLLIVDMNTTKPNSKPAGISVDNRELTRIFIDLGLFGRRPPRARRHLVAVFPDGTETRITRQRDGSYNGPGGNRYCAPLNYALEVWREAGAKIVRRETPINR